MRVILCDNAKKMVIKSYYWSRHRQNRRRQTGEHRIANRVGPGPCFGITGKRHRRDLSRLMAGDAAPFENRPNIAGKRGFRAQRSADDGQPEDSQQGSQSNLGARFPHDLFPGKLRRPLRTFDLLQTYRYAANRSRHFGADLAAGELQDDTGPAVL